MDGRRVAVLPATVNGKFRTFPKGHEKVPEKSGPECIIVAKAAQPLQPFLQPALRTVDANGCSRTQSLFSSAGTRTLRAPVFVQIEGFADNEIYLYQCSALS
jgi:hypothetical protein